MTDTPYVHSFEHGPAEIDDAIPPPMLMNCWKHHAGIIRQRIDATVAEGVAAVSALPDRLLQIGAALMDLYLGALTPEAIAAEVSAQLHAAGAGPIDAFRTWLERTEGYATLELSDTSRWVLREAPVDGRHVHVHPARYSPLSMRVRANLLRSAIITLAFARLHDRDPLETATVNEARVTLLAMSPVKAINADEGLGELLTRLLDGWA
ncbi:MAG: hypothetical protein AB7K09_00530 [Planctomycetota bacterium]